MTDTVDKILASIAFQHPVTHEDCAQVRDALRAATSATMIEVHHQRDQVFVVVDDVKRTVQIKPA